MKQRNPTHWGLSSKTGCLAFALCALGAFGTTAAAAQSDELAYVQPVSFELKPAGLPPDGTPLGTAANTVQCPATHPNPLGGGAAIVGDQSSLDLELHSSSPVAPVGPFPIGGWFIEANNSSDTRADVITTAICASGTDFEYMQASTRVQPGLSDFQTATCPAHTQLAGGGVDALGGDHTVEIASSAPSGHGQHPNSWSATINNGTHDPVLMVVTAICAHQGRYRVVRSPRAPVPDNSQVRASVFCPHGTRVTSGGVRTDGLNLNYEVAESQNIGPHEAPDKGWTGVANNQNTHTTTHIQVFAICKR